MKTRIQHFLELFDIPGGSILGAWSLVMLAMSVACFVRTAQGHPIDIPPNVKEVYNWLLSAFAVSKTFRTVFGKVVNEKTDA